MERRFIGALACSNAAGVAAGLIEDAAVIPSSGLLSWIVVGTGALIGGLLRGTTSAGRLRYSVLFCINAAVLMSLTEHCLQLRGTGLPVRLILSAFALIVPISALVYVSRTRRRRPGQP